VALADVRRVLDSGVPVLLGLTVFDTFYRPDADGHIADPPSGSSARGRHAVVAVGHQTDELLIRNSWGTTWALGGYAWIGTATSVPTLETHGSLTPLPSRLEQLEHHTQTRTRGRPMEFGDYQHEAQRTDQFTKEEKVVPLLGMGGEVGSLLAEYKKWMRDGEAHVLFPSRWRKNSATSSGISPTRRASSISISTAIATQNLTKTRDRGPRMDRSPYTGCWTSGTHRPSSAPAVHRRDP